MAVALRRYVHNTTVSEAMYTPLHGMEIALRNSLSRQLVDRFGAAWFEAGRIPPLRAPATQMLDSAAERLVKDRKDVNLNNMVAELNLGFWVTILGPKYEDLWRPERTAVGSSPSPSWRHGAHSHPLGQQIARATSSIFVMVLSPLG